MLEDFTVPECYGDFVCADDCMVSCPFWEECMHDHDYGHDPYAKEQQ